MIGMKKYFTCICTLAALWGLTTAAYADVIAATPGEIFLSSVGGWFPIALVAAVVVVTAGLLRKFWKRK